MCKWFCSTLTRWELPPPYPWSCWPLNWLCFPHWQSHHTQLIWQHYNWTGVDTSQKGWLSDQQFWQSYPHRVGLLESSSSHPFRQIPIYVLYVETLQQYEAATATLRGDSCKLFVTIKKPHKPVTSCTIACWLKEMLKLAGVYFFSGHSVRGVQLQLALPWMTSSKLQTGVQSQCSEGSTTDPLMMLHMVGQFYHLLVLVRPDH